MDACQQPGSHGTCGDDHPPLIGGHVGRRGAVLLVHVAVVIHGIGFASTNQLAAFADAAVHRRLPRWRRDKSQEVITATVVPTAWSSPWPIAQRTRVISQPHLVQGGEDAAEAVLFLFFF